MQNHDRERQEEVVEAAELWRLQETSARQKGTEERIKQCLQDNMKSWATPCEEATVREMRGVKREKENKLRIIHKQNRRQPTAHWYCKGATPTSSLQRPHPQTPLGHVCFPSILPREAYIDHSMLKCDLKNKQTVGYFKGETSDSQILLLLLHFLHRCFTLKAFQPLKGQTPTWY